jgi:hypothetical protein
MPIKCEKLSKLQKQILVLALANKQRENRGFEARGADLYYSEILREVYGFATTGPLREHPGGHDFDLTVIGRERYNAAQAAISRTMIRLHSRGLIHAMCGAISRWSGCNLTPLGVEAAETVKTKALVPQS